MSRIKEKVKDIIEVRPYQSPIDLQIDPLMTLESYHFTDITSELMANWLDDVINVSIDCGKAKALAGYRGVGKSHFLATFGALLSKPELRSKITDSHVATSAQHLMRRHYPVAYVKRGTQNSILEEIRVAVSESLGFGLNEVPEREEDILSFVSRKSNEIPFVFIVDTSFEREARVSRDDGGTLGKLAEIAKQYNVFIGIALDDDITEADGINVAIARTFSIDYLDQEHLYKIVNAHIFPKQRQNQAIINQIYRYFREVCPAFHWSEQSFQSLYPLHPVILEVAPFVRLYAHNFALFSFASDAGEKILGRPASSLISLDEVFDNVEHRLRKSEELSEAFTVFDKISNEITTQIPVMQRLQAKLILKALFILSLDGDGTTAADICAAMLICDENEPDKAIKNVEDLLEMIVSIFPKDITRKVYEDKPNRYSLKVSSKDKLNTALEETIKTISPENIPLILRRVAKEKFPDWNLSVEGNEEMEVWTDCQILWRGGFRRCRIYWNWNNEAAEVLQVLENSEYLDLEIFINNPNKQSLELPKNSDIPRAIWQPSELTKEESETILRFFALLNDEKLRNEFKEQVRAAGHTHSLQIEKIWERIFFRDAKILVEGNVYEFNEQLKDKQTLGELISLNLEKYFETIYPQHPVFAKPLGMNEVSKLVNDLFSGARKTHEGIQQLAETYAQPLGLVSQRGETFVLETEENLYRLPLVEKILTLVSQSDNETVLLKTIYKRLKEKPFGLIREAQHLIMAALVAQRKIEFVTTNSDRINRRSLDLKIIWDDIAGIAKPADIVYGSKRLTDWAKMLTDLKDVQIIDVAEDRNQVKEGLSKWLENWNEACVFERFSELSDEILNTKIWYISINIEKTFGTVANALQSFVEESISLEDCLQRVADAFSDSEEEFKVRQNELIALISFIRSAANREKIWNYLAICEKTEDQEIEDLRTNLFELLAETATSPTSEKNRQMEILWQDFQDQFSDYFLQQHDAIMKSHQLQAKIDEILKSDQWWEFQNLSQISVFPQKFWIESQKILKQFRELDCRFDVKAMLKSHPFCACSFHLTQKQKWENLPRTLIAVIEAGRESYRGTISVLTEILIPLLENYSQNENDQTFRQAGVELLEALKNRAEIKKLTTIQLSILHNLLSNLNSNATINVQFPYKQGLMNSLELKQNLNKWIDELPSETVYLNLK